MITLHDQRLFYDGDDAFALMTWRDDSSRRVKQEMELITLVETFETPRGRDRPHRQSDGLYANGGDITFRQTGWSPSVVALGVA